MPIRILPITQNCKKSVYYDESTAKFTTHFCLPKVPHNRAAQHRVKNGMQTNHEYSHSHPQAHLESNC